METIGIAQVYKELMNLRKDVIEIKIVLEEDFDVADDVLQEIAESRNRPKSQLISNVDMKKEFA